jgi:uncharacterized protein YmfQ (DUF2313 family)
MPNVIQPLPTKSGAVGDLARQLLRLLGPAFPAPDDSLNAADALNLGRAISDARDTTVASLDEAFPDAALYTLDSWETMLGLPVSAGRLTTTERRAALLARWRTRFSGSPDAIVSALTPLNSGNAPTMRETVAIESFAHPVQVFVFTIRTAVDPTDAAANAPLRATVDVMKPAHTAVQFTDQSLTAGFRCNDPGSLTNNTVLL